MDGRECYKKTLDEIHVPESTLQNIKNRTYGSSAKTGNRFIRLAVGAAVLALFMVIVLQTNLIIYAAEGLKNLWIEITGNSYQIVGSLEPKELDVSDFTPIDINQETAAYEKHFLSVSEIAGKYNVNLLQSDLAYNWDDTYTVLAAYGEEGAINGIRIISPYYIMGDLPIEPDAMKKPSSADIIPDLLYGSELHGFDFYREYTYQSPIYYSAYIYEAETYDDYTTGGLYEMEGVEITEYTSEKNNVEAVIATYPFLTEADELNPETRAHFIYDGIEYRLEGRVQLQQMMQIIDSLYLKK